MGRAEGKCRLRLRTAAPPTGHCEAASDGRVSLPSAFPRQSRHVAGVRIGERITVAAWKETVPFSSNENWDSPRVIDSPILSNIDIAAAGAIIRRSLSEPRFGGCYQLTEYHPAGCGRL